MGGTTIERDIFASRLVAVLIAMAVVGLLVFGMAGCAATSHTFGLATTDDVRAERDDQRAIDNHIANGAADMHEGKVTPADFVNDVAAVGTKAVERTYRRTEPPPPPKGGGSLPEIVAALALAAYTAFVHRSVKQTDAWVGDVEAKKIDKAGASST